MEREHHVPQDKELQVHAGDYVDAGDPLIRGPIIPHDILRIKGEEALYQYLLTEVQNVYRSQGVKINDKHIEIILNQMLRKVKVEDPGDTKFLPGEVLDKFRFRAGNDLASQSVKVVEPAAPTTRKTTSSSRLSSRKPTRPPKPLARIPPRARRPSPPAARRFCWASPRRRCKAKALSVPPASRRPPRCSPKRRLAGAIDTLVGLKENVILGHLIPAGTAFNPHLNLKIKHLAQPPVEDEGPITRVPRESALQSDLAPQAARDVTRRSVVAVSLELNSNGHGVISVAVLF